MPHQIWISFCLMTFSVLLLSRTPSSRHVSPGPLGWGPLSRPLLCMTLAGSEGLSGAQ